MKLVMTRLINETGGQIYKNTLPYLINNKKKISGLY